MTQFSVDPAALADMAGRLRGLEEEFNGLEDTVEGYEEAVGSDELADKLRSFADNWSDKRKEIAKQIENVAGYATAAADAYSQHEQAMSSRISGAGGGGGGGGGADASPVAGG